MCGASVTQVSLHTTAHCSEHGSLHITRSQDKPNPTPDDIKDTKKRFFF